MKQFYFLLLLAFANGLAFGQGEVMFTSSPANKVFTNSPNGIGLTATNANGFYYGLFIAPAGTTGFSNFSFTGNYATNTALLGHFYGYDVPNGVSPVTVGASVVDGWLPGTTMSYLICGWSSNLGHDWSEIASQLATSDWVGFGFFGQSTIGQAIAGGINGGPIPAPQLMGPGQGVVLELDSLSIAVPEPGSLALINLGAAILVWQRRR